MVDDTLSLKGTAMIMQRLTVAAVTAFILASPASAVTGYTLTDLGFLPGLGPGTIVQANGLNDLGDVVGIQQTGATVQGFRWTAAGGMTSVGAVHLNDLNNAGTATGYTSTGFARALVNQPNGATTIFGGLLSYGRGINAAGAIAGTAQDPFPPRGFVRAANGTLVSAAQAPNSAYLNAINDGGVAAGGYNVTAATWTAAGGWRALSNPFGASATANGINNLGMVAGTAYTASGTSYQGVVWAADGTPQLIGSLTTVPQSELFRINDNGVAVGFAQAPDNSGARAIRWSSTGGLQNLNDLINPSLGWRLVTANDINSSGQIVGSGLNAEGRLRAYLLTPITLAGAIPEPSSWAMLIAGFGLTGAAMRRRRMAVTI